MKKISLSLAALAVLTACGTDSASLQAAKAFKQFNDTHELSGFVLTEVTATPEGFDPGTITATYRTEAFPLTEDEFPQFQTDLENLVYSYCNFKAPATVDKRLKLDSFGPWPQANISGLLALDSPKAALPDTCSEMRKAAASLATRAFETAKLSTVESITEDFSEVRFSSAVRLSEDAWTYGTLWELDGFQASAENVTLDFYDSWQDELKERRGALSQTVELLTQRYPAAAISITFEGAWLVSVEGLAESEWEALTMDLQALSSQIEFAVESPKGVGPS